MRGGSERAPELERFSPFYGEVQKGKLKLSSTVDLPLRIFRKV